MSPHLFQSSHPIRHPTPPSNPYPQPHAPHFPVPGPLQPRLFNGLDALVHAATEERRRLSSGSIAAESPLSSRASPVEPSSPAHQFHPSRHDRHQISDDHGHSPSQQLPIVRPSPIQSSLHAILSPAPPMQSPIYPPLQHRQHTSHEGSNTRLSPVDDLHYRSSQAAVVPLPHEPQSPRHHLEQEKRMQHVELQRQRQHHEQLVRQEHQHQHQFMRERHNQAEVLVPQGSSIPLSPERTSQPRLLPSPNPIIYNGGRRSDPGLLHGSVPFLQPGLPSFPNAPAPSQLHVGHIASHPDKKRRYSDSPYISSGEAERLHYEREKMAPGDLGYGRLDTAMSTSSLAPRPPSNHGNGRKHLALSELVAINREREWPNPTNTSTTMEPMHDGRSLGSPLGRRSPPGSQIGRARAARKSDETYPDRQQPTMEKELPSENEDKKISSPLNLQVHHPPPPPDEVSRLELKHSPPLAHSPLPPSKPHEEDAHEWFLEHFDEYSGPRQSTQHPPPSLPSPIAPSKSPVPKKKMLPPVTMPEAAVALERELEELVVSQPMKVEQEIDIDMDVDLAVSELVAETLEVHDPKAEHVAMEVDVEDELLSLVDDRPIDRCSSYHASTSSKHPPPLQSIDESKIMRPRSPSATAPFAPSPPVSRQPSNRPSSDRGSMPPPLARALSKGKDKDGKRGEQAGSVVAPASAQKKVKDERKVCSSYRSPFFALLMDSCPSLPLNRRRLMHHHQQRRNLVPKGVQSRNLRLSMDIPPPLPPSQMLRQVLARSHLPFVHVQRLSCRLDQWVLKVAI